MTDDKPPELQLPIRRRLLELEHAEKIVRAMAKGELEGLTDAEREQIIIAIAGEDAPLFDPDTLELYGWQRDHNGCWVPPDIHAIDADPLRGVKASSYNRLRPPAPRPERQAAAARQCRSSLPSSPPPNSATSPKLSGTTSCGHGGRTTERTGFTAGTGGPI